MNRFSEPPEPRLVRFQHSWLARIPKMVAPAGLVLSLLAALGADAPVIACAITDLTAEQAHKLEVVRRSGQGLMTLLDDLLDLSKLEAGRMDIEQIPWQPGPLIDDVVALLQHADRAPGVEVRAELHDLPPTLPGDPTRVRQVLVNLLGNAIKFTRQGAVVVRASHSAGSLSIAVEDTGPGIAPEHLSRVFNPFEQADSSTSRRHGGSGLGLAISRRLVHLMQGTLTVASSRGVGSTFTMSIPVQEGPPVEEERPSAHTVPVPALGPSAGRLLVVDDNPVNLAVATSMLEHLGFDVHAVDSGDRALEDYDSSPWDLVFMDCQMPGLDGFETCKRLRDRGVHTPILALTAGLTPAERQRCVESGMNAVVAKPVTLAQLRTATSRWIEAPQSAVRRPDAAGSQAVPR